VIGENKEPQMSDNLSPEIHDKLHSLCKKITDSYHLDTNSKEKMFASIAKKFNEYYFSEKKLTEDEALILVREHFGKPDQIRELLEEVHVMETHISLARRIGAVLAATIGVGVLIHVVMYLIQFPLDFIFGIRIEPTWLPGYLYIILNPVILYIVLKRWRNTEERGDSVWFQQVPQLMMALIIGILFTADTVIPMAYYAAQFYLLHSPPFYNMISNGVNIIFQNHYNIGTLLCLLFHSNKSHDTLTNLIALGSNIAQCAVWLWWCDGFSRRLTARAASVGAWVAFVFLTATYQPALYIHNDVTRHAAIFISWRHENVDAGKFPTYTMATVLLGVCVLMIYVFMKSIIERNKKDPTVVTQ
jgi:hypothetical protein